MLDIWKWEVFSSSCIPCLFLQSRFGKRKHYFENEMQKMIISCAKRKYLHWVFIFAIIFFPLWIEASYNWKYHKNRYHECECAFESPLNIRGISVLYFPKFYLLQCKHEMKWKNKDEIPQTMCIPFEIFSTDHSAA